LHDPVIQTSAAPQRFNFSTIGKREKPATGRRKEKKAGVQETGIDRF
jgi:hypothetical protein